MSEREWLVRTARAKGYRPTDDDTDTDLVWVIRNYRGTVAWPSRSTPPTFPDARESIRVERFSIGCENLEEMLAVLG